MSELGRSMPTRPARGRLVGGVCAGLAGQLGIDPALIRLGFMLLTFAWGAGLVLYVLLWLAMPTDETAAPPSSLKQRARHNLHGMPAELRASGRRFETAWRQAGRRPSSVYDVLDRRSVALALVAIGGLVFLGAIGALDWLTPVRIVGLLAVIGGTFILIAFRDR